MDTLSLNPVTDICQAVFIDSFKGANRYFSNDSFQTTLSKNEVLDVIKTAFRFTIHDITGIGVFSGDIGAIKISALNSCSSYTYIEIECMAPSYVVQYIYNVLTETQYVNPRKDGVYEILIRHWYLSNDDDMRYLTHSRTNEDFQKLLVDMYPRIDIKEMMRLYSESDESNIILTGDPGTGKTCFAKMMMGSHAENKGKDLEVVYVKDRNLLKLDEFWAMMSNKEPDMLILDDLDDELRPRVEERNEIVNNLLSYSDGIFDMATKIIITTNLTDKSIDKALIRPGRCFDILALPQLSITEAKNIWTNTYHHSDGQFVERFSNCGTGNISQAALASEHQRILKDASETYLRDPTISIRTVVEDGRLPEDA